MEAAAAWHAWAISGALRSASPSASATPSRAPALKTQLREYAIAISSRSVGAVTFPIPLLAGILRPPSPKNIGSHAMDHATGIIHADCKKWKR
jgi:hypothetical protein